MNPEPIKKFADIFSKLPSIGPRQAIRLGFYLANSSKDLLNQIEEAVRNIKKLKTCSECFSVHDNNENLCPVCSDNNRDSGTVAFLERQTDLFSIEKTSKFKGRYLVLGTVSKDGSLSSNQKLRIQNLQNRIKKQFGLLPEGGLKELILAFNPTTFGDFTANLIAQEMKPFAKKISRLGRGIPTGGEIEFADEETLSSALERRL